MLKLSVPTLLKTVLFFVTYVFFWVLQIVMKTKLES